MGIDPGQNGGIVTIDHTRKIISKYVMPVKNEDLDSEEVADILAEGFSLGCHVFLERVKAYGMNPGASFTFGRYFGKTELLVKLSKLPVTYIEPAKWTKEIHQGIDANIKAKAKSGIAFERLYPGTDFRTSEKCKKPHDGLIDALLIAEYGLRNSLKEKSWEK
jgi:hypothetical protein